MVARLPEVDPQVMRRVLTQSAYTASRTKWFDEFFIAAGLANVRQAVILAAGLEVGVRSLGQSSNHPNGRPLQVDGRRGG
jgi:O-methyltransferase involved in polyketide biosynthesis